jgi:DNA-binding NarL/FixJ family response regulator
MTRFAPTDGDCEVTVDDGAPGGWLLLRPHLVPEQWAARAVEMRGVWLGPEEMSGLLGPAEPEHRLTPEERELVPLVAAGLTRGAIADRLHVSPRTVQRRIARLRSRVGAGTHAELVAVLARGRP